ncbi:MAG: lytic murein transglycosylase, partial [Pseudomonadota bacterium]
MDEKGRVMVRTIIGAVGPRAIAGIVLALTAGVLAACTTTGSSSFPRVVSVQCGTGPQGFAAWKDAFAQEAIAKGIDAGVVNSSLAGLTYSTSVVALDRDQSAFRASFEAFYARRVSNALIARGKRFNPVKECAVAADEALAARNERVAHPARVERLKA